MHSCRWRPRTRDRRGGGARGMRPRGHEHPWTQGSAGSPARQRRERSAAPRQSARSHGPWCAATDEARVNASSASQPLSGPVEDYLKAIYDLERGAQPATTNEIAERLAISPASVSGMVRRLADQGLITHEPYRGVRLTASGRRAALRTLRRHRILECYLTEVLGYPWDRVHEEAEELEHTASEELINRRDAALGNPRFDPHGAPMPTPDGEGDENPLRSLADASADEVVR